MTLYDLYQLTKKSLQNAGIEASQTEARYLFEGVLGIDFQNVLLCGDLEATAVQVQDIRDAVAKRATGYPLQYITGLWEFYSYQFEVGEGVLIPRADSEALCDVAIRTLLRCRTPVPVVADLCSGSGCLAVAVALKCDNAKVYAVEKYGEALYYLRRNVRRNKAPVTVVQGDVLDSGVLSSAGPIDLIICNPPYLAEDDMRHLQKEVTFEPETALYGSKDGLMFYRMITKQWLQRLRPGGTIAFEIGRGQEEDVSKIFREGGYQNICTYQDLCGIIRVLTAERPLI